MAFSNNPKRMTDGSRFLNLATTGVQNRSSLLFNASQGSFRNFQADGRALLDQFEDSVTSIMHATSAP